jgi:hypothetical protein
MRDYPDPEGASADATAKQGDVFCHAGTEWKFGSSNRTWNAANPRGAYVYHWMGKGWSWNSGHPHHRLGIEPTRRKAMAKAVQEAASPSPLPPLPPEERVHVLGCAFGAWLREKPTCTCERRER